MTAVELETRFRGVLAKNRLLDLSQFYRADFCEEMPLYTRESDIDFLCDCRMEAKNEWLLDFAVKFLDSVIAFEEHTKPFFAAITAWNFSDDDPIIPNLFVWSRSVEELHDVLTLHEAKTSFGKKMEKALSESARKIDVLEDTSTMPEMERVFIGPSQAPYANFVILDSFTNAVAVR